MGCIQTNNNTCCLCLVSRKVQHKEQGVLQTNDTAYIRPKKFYACVAPLYAA